jgi:peptidyl-prolyl cis-trans isomerase SurA
MKKLEWINKYFIIFLFSITIASQQVNASKKVFIAVKVNNEIITNIDIENEARYLLALNKELESLKEDEILNLARSSIIKEKIKKNELIKYYKLSSENNYIDNLIKTFYTKLDLKNTEEFEAYIKSYGLNIKDIKQKIEIESLWNSLIFDKYKNQVQINRENLKTKLNNQFKDKAYQEKYNLSEILFNLDKNESLNQKYSIIKESINKNGFKNTANIFSISDTGKFGGEIGWINGSQLSKNIKNQINKMKINQITEPIIIPGGFLLLKINEISKEEIKINFEDELSKLIAFEKNKQLNQYSLIYFNKIKINSKVE